MTPPLEVWGGVECTVNRVGEEYFDQLAASGHDGRLGDLDRFRELGLKTLRFPIPWEKLAAGGPGRPMDWSWADARLGRARELGLGVIVGFLHHGSGPRHTHLLDPGLPEKLAALAAAFAARYPWVEAYTPVNEPLTTARFSGLYGHWYPHRQDGRSFFAMVVYQCQAVAAAMAAIRRIRPDARLVQTEDLGEVSSTPRLTYQAEFENARRWLSFDLLTGRFGPAHPLWPYAVSAGVPARLLAAAAALDCPPQLLGINHYVTSNRFLDERLERYAPALHGGNGLHRYADLEAVRVEAAPATGLDTLLLAAWERYGLPLAVTEAHLGCTSEEQLRWLAEVWGAARTLHARGVPVQAVTVWSLLGSFDWDSLVTRRDLHYEPGVFDVRAPEPRPTALAAMVRSLCAAGEYHHPALATPGWWRRADRFLLPANARTLHRPSLQGRQSHPVLRKKVSLPRIGIAGAGLAGAVLARELAESGRFKVDLFEERDHIAGNCHTSRDPESGVMLHHYGPHIFNTHREDVWRYVNRFADFGPYTNRVKATTARGVFSLPINLLTINQFFGKSLRPPEARAFLESLGDASITDPQTFEEQALRFLGRELYDNFFYGYTKKQWGVEPRELPASILKRLPVRFNYDDNYFTNRFQGIPVDGYTALVERMLDHPALDVHLSERFEPSYRSSFEHVFWSGPMDAFFGYELGRLGYRTLVFERFDDTGDFQGNAVMNYCEEAVPFTRIAEHKHFAPWEEHEKTVCFREYSKATEPGDTPYYPLRLAGDKGLLEAYQERAEEETGVTFIGRLGTYRYLDMHVVVGESIDLARTCLGTSEESWPRFSGPPVEQARPLARPQRSAAAA